MRVGIIVVTGVHVVGEQDLFDVIDVQRQLRPVLSAGQRGEKNTRQDRDDGDDHQQFDQSKSQKPSVGARANTPLNGVVFHKIIGLPVSYKLIRKRSTSI